MSFIAELKALIARRGATLTALAPLVGMARPNLTAALSGRHDPRASTLDAIAFALDAQWVLVPRERLEAVERALEGKDAGPDRDAKSAADLFMESQS
jgi:transcriptional regulator with XRE-family HTH domain